MNDNIIIGLKTQEEKINYLINEFYEKYPDSDLSFLKKYLIDLDNDGEDELILHNCTGVQYEDPYIITVSSLKNGNIIASIEEIWFDGVSEIKALCHPKYGNCFALITSFRQSDIQIYALYRNQLINIYSFNAQYRVYNDGYDEIIHAEFQDLNNDGYDETILTIKEYRDNRSRAEATTRIEIFTWDMERNDYVLLTEQLK